MDEHNFNRCPNCGVSGQFFKYEDNDELWGGFCKRCKQEYKIDQGRLIRNQGGTVPTLCCLPVSELATEINWEEINTEEVLKAGDHIVWWRAAGYWHHGIVKSINNESHTINVYEVELCAIEENVHREDDTWAICFHSPMYRVNYPESVKQNNPPELVLMRAQCRVEPQCYQFCRDNCEHYAHFCKTGRMQSNQIKQLTLTCFTGWSKRLIFTLIRVIIEVLVAEIVEESREDNSKGIESNQNRKDWIGVVVLISIEMFYLIVCGFVIYCNDVRRSDDFGFEMSQVWSPEIICHFLKIVLQSALAVGLSIVFSIPVRNNVRQKRDPNKLWSNGKVVRVEIGLGIAGAFLGNFVGYILFQILPMCCCRNFAYN